ncbi:MAG TPA: rRNA maturation RNase YbeY [Candidatus Acidoferrales bacterium]|jgi:probable rRNA maturation factor|nr:rRNA maturation RNase YbeY [Candidatus Acidoferrales bacterium]
MILNRQRSVRLSIRALESFLLRVRRELGLKQAQVTVCLVSDAEIAGMNQSFRKKHGPTDVLSFPAVRLRKPTRSTRIPVSLESVPVDGDASLGDIAIAPAVAKRNAKNYGRTLPAELKILILHGVLHLLGFDHEADRGEMDRTEKKLRRRLGLA